MKFYLPTILILVFFLSSCKDDDITKDLPDDVTFTQLPADLSPSDEFAAIGQLTGIPKSHGGFRLANHYMLNPDIPVYAMSDGIIYNIRYEGVSSDHPNIPPELKGKEYDDYSLEIYLTKTAKMHYGHLSELAPKILEAAGTINYGRGVENRVKIPIKEGQILAYVGRHPGFDIGLTDLKRQAYFANPSRYTPEYMGSLPFTEFLTSALREKIWEINPRTAEPRGGKVAYDVEGTLSGNWFLLGTTSLTEWSKQLVIAKHEHWAERITIMDGSPLFDGDGKLNNGVPPNLWWLVGNSPDPKTITSASGKVKFKVAEWWKLQANENWPAEGTVMFEISNNQQLKFEFFKEQLPDEVNDFTNSVRIYER